MSNGPTYWCSRHGFPGVREHLGMSGRRQPPKGRQLVYLATPDRLRGLRHVELNVVDGFPDDAVLVGEGDTAEHVNAAQLWLMECTLSAVTVVRHGETPCSTCKAQEGSTSPCTR